MARGGTRNQRFDLASKRVSTWSSEMYRPTSMASTPATGLAAGVVSAIGFESTVSVVFEVAPLLPSLVSLPLSEVAAGAGSEGGVSSVDLVLLPSSDLASGVTFASALAPVSSFWLSSEPSPAGVVLEFFPSTGPADDFC